MNKGYRTVHLRGAMYVFRMHNVLQSTTEGISMNKSISISIRVSGEELERLKTASKIEEYSSYSEFIRRTALLEANKILTKDDQNENR